MPMCREIHRYDRTVSAFDTPIDTPELRGYLAGVINIRSNMEEIRIHLHAFLFGEAMADVTCKAW